MTLAQYLKSQNLPLVTLAADLGEKVTTVHGWVSGRRKPGVVSLARIERVTSGAVRAADFVPKEAAEAARGPANARCSPTSTDVTPSPLEPIGAEQ